MEDANTQGERSKARYMENQSGAGGGGDGRAEGWAGEVLRAGAAVSERSLGWLAGSMDGWMLASKVRIAAGGSRTAKHSQQGSVC